jgi:23S rRNA pseudouridine2605 synthase
LKRARSGPRGAGADRLEKLQKVLADLGYGSRRELEQWIAAGRVTVNNMPAHVGQRVGASDRIRVDGQPVRTTRPEGVRVLALNKPAGVICTRRDPEGRATVFDDLPPLVRGRWISIGRLDVQTTGLLLLTNDGALAHRMMHPSTGLDREYAVRLRGRLSDEEIAALREGVIVDGERLAFSDIAYYDGSGTNHWYHVALMEGRNREVRRLFEAVGITVSRLKRVRFGPVVLPSFLRSGRRTELSADDVRALYEVLGLPRPAVARERHARDRGARSLLIPYPKLAPAPKHRPRGLGSE